MTIEQECRSAADRLLNYLAEEFDDQGVSKTAPDNFQYYYKLPAILCYSGRRRLAYRILNQFAGRFISGGKFDLSVDPVGSQWIPYLGGFVAWGAGMLGRFDVSYEMMQRVHAYRDLASGGFQFQAADGTTLLDVERTGAALMGYVWAGDTDSGRAAAKFLSTVLEHQPAPQDKFGTHMSLDGHVIPDPSDRSSFYGLRDPLARPALLVPGIAGLVWLSRETNDGEPVELANTYMQIVLEHNSDPATLSLATRLGWAALMLGVHRNGPMMSDLAHRCARSLIERQCADGSIDFDDLPKPIDKQWLVVLGCDCALTLMAVADGTA